jgi:RHS repeat-associated protein
MRYDVAIKTGIEKMRIQGVCMQSASDYSPFGVLLDGRSMQKMGYRYGFGGMENDDEVKGEGKSSTTEYRQLDTRLGRWLSIDPLTKSFSYLSPFNAFNNNPIRLGDITGMAPDDFVKRKDGSIYWDKKAISKKTTKAGVASGKSINVIGAQGETEQATLRDDGFYYTSGGNKFDEKGTQVAAGGGLAALTMAGGGMSGQFDLGGYSDGGRLLRGPGDGVSDSIPATIGNKRPARLADGEFVVPARIVSELGNGSTEAGARKLYAMMDRVQAARKGSIGKGKVAKNSRAEKYLPA